MTDPLAPLTDEDLSAVLDGEADAALEARVQADAGATARLAQLRTASEAVRSAAVPSLDASVVDDLIGRALAVADEPTFTGPDANDPDRAEDDVVRPLAPPNHRRPGGVPAWLVAAAVVVLVGIGLVLVYSGRNDGSGSDDLATSKTEQTTTADRAAAAPSSGSDSRADQSSGAASASPTTTAAFAPHGVPTTVPAAGSDATDTDLVPLGSFADGSALRTALKTSFPRSTAAGAEADARRLAPKSVSRCDTLVRTILSIDAQSTGQGVATVAGKEVLVYEYPATNPKTGKATTLVAAVGSAACDQVVTFYR